MTVCLSCNGWMRARSNFASVVHVLALNVCGWGQVAIENARGVNKDKIRRPSVLAFSRQGMPNLPGSSIEGTAKGGYVVHGGDGKPDVILIGTGLHSHSLIGPLPWGLHWNTLQTHVGPLQFWCHQHDRQTHIPAFVFSLDLRQLLWHCIASVTASPSWDLGLAGAVLCL